jgi:cell wall-associated NlpC family hydrolase
VCQESLTRSKWIGIPYKLNGRDTNGTDCLGLVWMYLKDQGIVFPDGDGLPIDTAWTKNGRERMLGKLREIAVKVETPQANDIVLIHWVHQAAHLGVMVDSQNMLHISFDRTSEICPVTYFGHRVLGIWRVVK